MKKLFFLFGFYLSIHQATATILDTSIKSKQIVYSFDKQAASVLIKFHPTREPQDSIPARHIHLALDVSGSMMIQNQSIALQNQPIELLKTAVIGVIQAMNPIDSLSMTIFNDKLVPYPALQMTPDNASAYIEIVKQLKAEGTTNLTGALKQSVTKVTTLPYAADTAPPVAAVMLFTDGEHYIQDPYTRTAKETNQEFCAFIRQELHTLPESSNVVVYSFGLGSNYKSEALCMIQEPTSRTSFLTHIPSFTTEAQDTNPNSIFENLLSAVGNLKDVVVKQAQVTCTIDSENASPESDQPEATWLETTPRPRKCNKNETRTPHTFNLDLPYLMTDHPFYIAAQIQLPQVSAATVHRMSCQLKYTDSISGHQMSQEFHYDLQRQADGTVQTDPEVADLILALELPNTLTEISTLKTQNPHAALELTQNTIALIRQSQNPSRFSDAMESLITLQESLSQQIAPPVSESQRERAAREQANSEQARILAAYINRSSGQNRSHSAIAPPRASGAARASAAHASAAPASSSLQDQRTALLILPYNPATQQPPTTLRLTITPDDLRTVGSLAKSINDHFHLISSPRAGTTADTAAGDDALSTQLDMFIGATKLVRGSLIKKLNLQGRAMRLSNSNSPSTDYKGTQVGPIIDWPPGPTRN